MLLIIKIILLQLFWYLSVLHGSATNEVIIFAGAILIVIVNYIVFKPPVSLKKYIAMTVVFSLYGYLFESTLLSLEIITVKQSSYPLWMNSLWVIFICYYGDIFNKFKDLKALNFIIGGLAAVSAYKAGQILGAMEINHSIYFYSSIFIFWGLFFYISIKTYYHNFIINKLLDLSIIFSFDNTGYQRHKKLFANEDISLSGQNILITGGTSGIGYATAKTLINHKANIYVTGREKNKFKAISSSHHFIRQDLANWEQIKESIKNLPVFNCIILNAGGMPDKLTINKQGFEFQAASQLLGHYLLLTLLKEQNKLAKDARIIWVSSGGMYLKKFERNILKQHDNYNKVTSYANTKRSQVMIAEAMSESPYWSNYNVYAMHPGWVETPGIKSAIPGFVNIISKNLRSPVEGADTICWLTYTQKNIQNGSIYFDRIKRNPYPLFWLKQTKKDSKELYQMIHETIKGDL